MEAKIFNQLLSAGIKASASDVHLKVGAPPMFRIDGRLREIKAPKLAPEDTRNIVMTIMAAGKLQRNVDELLELDTSYLLSELGRFRVNVFRQRGSFEIVLRIIPLEVPTVEKLGLPPVLKDIASNERGLVLVTGITGSGKSSSLAAMIHHINENFRKHILTIEDPIEFLHNDLNCSISQREVGSDTVDFPTALRAALREDPDVILVGEIRDYETVDIALKAAETGHLVFSTLHTTDATHTVNRLIGLFPMEEQDVVRMRLAESLKAIISQRLLPRQDGKGRIVAAEIMINTATMQDCIRTPDKTSQIREYIEKGRDQYHMQSFDQHLSWLFRKQIITLEVAKAAATNASDFERALSFE